MKPLDGLIILDLTTALAGPYATLLLAGLGARVIKIENPGAGDSCRTNAPYLGKDGASLTREHASDVSISELSRLRNKLGITLNLKDQRGREIFFDLIRKSDIVVENFSRGTLDRLGVGYAAASAVNAKIIYSSITGFGNQGEPGSGKAMDTIIQALSGVMMTSGITGDPPVRVGVPFADLCAPLFAVIGTLAAVHQLKLTGVGQHVDVSMLGVLTSMVAAEPFDVLERAGVPQRTGLTVPRLSPFGIYPSKDGYMAICAPQEPFARALFDAIGRPDLALDTRFNSRDARVRNVAEMNAILAEFTSKRTVAEGVIALEAHGVPCAEVRDPAQAVRDPRVVSRGETIRVTHPQFGAVDEIYGPGLPIRFSAAEAGFDRPAPAMGEHNKEIYCDWLGYSETDYSGLISAKVI
jgi:CoA:oxalate CoA-transferase